MQQKYNKIYKINRTKKKKEYIKIINNNISKMS